MPTPRFRSVRWTVGLMVVCLFARAEAGEGIPSKETILAEYPRAVAALEARFSQCRGEGFFTTFLSANHKQVRQTQVEFAFSGENGRVTRTPLVAVDANRVIPAPPQDAREAARVYQTTIVYNEAYSFSILKKTPTSDPVVEWTEAGIGRGIRLANGGHGQPLHRVVVGDQRTIARLMALPTTRIDRITEVPRTSQPGWLRVEFSLPVPEGPRPGASPITSGWIVVAVPDHWILHDYGLTSTVVANGAQYTRMGHVEYKREPTGDLQIVKCVSKMYAGRHSVDPANADPAVISLASDEIQYTRLQLEAVPVGEFTLSAFGFPEFVPPAPRP